MRCGVLRPSSTLASVVALAATAAAQQADLEFAERSSRVVSICEEARETAGPLERRSRRDAVERTVGRALGRLADAGEEFAAARPAAARGALASATRTAVRARRLARRELRRLDAAVPRWSIVLRDLTATLFAVWTSPGPDPWVVATGASDGRGPLFLVGRGEGFVRVPAGDEGDLWWVDEVPGSGLFACGTEGRVVRYDLATGAVSAIPTGAVGTLYGIWGASGDEVWTVGVGPGDEKPLLFRYDGAAWTRLPAPPGAEGTALYKVWGRAKDDVWACGTRGTLVHYDGTGWSAVPSGIDSTLLTVHRGVAVGEVYESSVVERRGDGSWRPGLLPRDTRSLAGVFAAPRDREGTDAWAVGYFGTVLRREDGRWRREGRAPVPEGLDLHAVRVDATGAVWMTGGDIFGLDDGVLLHRGPRSIGGDVLPAVRYAADVLPVLERTCGGCHATLPALDAHPGRPSRGGLARVLAGEHPGGAPDAPPGDLDVLRAWVLGGAIAE